MGRGLPVMGYINEGVCQGGVVLTGWTETWHAQRHWLVAGRGHSYPSCYCEMLYAAGDACSSPMMW